MKDDNREPLQWWSNLSTVFRMSLGIMEVIMCCMVYGALHDCVQGQVTPSGARMIHYKQITALFPLL